MNLIIEVTYRGAGHYVIYTIIRGMSKGAQAVHSMHRLCFKSAQGVH